MNDKRQKNQLQMLLAFTGEGRSEAPKAPREGTEAFTAKCETESPAGEEQLTEEVCGRENCQQALRRVKSNKGSPGIDGMKVDGAAGLPEAALASNTGTAVGRDLPPATGEASRDREAGRRSAQAGHSDGAGSIYPAGGDAGSARQMGPDVLRTQSRVSSATLGASGGGQGATVYRRRQPLGGGSRSGKVLRSSEPRQADGGDRTAGERQEDAQADPSFPGVGCDGKRAGESGGRRNSARRAFVTAAVESRARRTRPRVRAASSTVSCATRMIAISTWRASGQESASCKA